MKIKLCTFNPLCATYFGRNAITNYNFLPFVDGSCRREPDFENKFPSISSLCRASKLAPHLDMDDIVIYITKKGNWGNKEKAHYRLVAILRVLHEATDHIEGSRWYLKRNLPIPSNCMINNNPPLELFKTGGNPGNAKQFNELIRKTLDEQSLIVQKQILDWDGRYKYRAKKWPKFLITEPLFLDLSNPPILNIEDMQFIFGKVPVTQNAKNISIVEFDKLLKLNGINISH